MNKLNTLKTKDDLAQALGFSNARYLNYLLYVKKVDKLYHSFEIPKKRGGLRTIHAPNSELKKLQRKLSKFLWICYIESLESKSKDKNFKNPNISHGFEKNKSIITNAEIHRNKNYILNIDVKDFFDSFNFGRVRGFFIKDREFATSPEIATMIAQIVCYKGKLPQGAPSSPIITNLISRILDYRIIKLCKKYRFSYTRYVDDMTFSTNRLLFSNKLLAKNELETFLAELKRIVISSGFEINADKTRLSDSQQRQEVTGLVVNKKINVKREYFKNTKAMAFKLYKDGIFEIDGVRGTLEQLAGRFGFIFQISQYNNYLLYRKSLSKNNLEYQKYLLSSNLAKKSEYKYYLKYIFYNKDLIREAYYNSQHKTYNIPTEFYGISKDEKKNYMSLFDSKEKEYKKFLFYRYFFGNSKPIIVTEGKTDIRYIKAALKNLASHYPELIAKVGNKFVFNVEFLKHSDTIEYLFNVPEGGEGFKYWYNYFSDKEKFQMSDNEKLFYPNYMEYFQKLTLKRPQKPTIFLFDNEPPGSPLYKFTNYASDLEIKNNNLAQIRGNHFGRIAKRNSLYVMATPLLNGSEKSDIEDLILACNPSLTLKGKKFSKSGGSNYYGKDIFSKYVLKNYKKFDFKEFIPLLDGIRDNILDYG